VEVDGDVMVARLVRLAFKSPPGTGRLHGRQLLFPHDVEIRSSPRIGNAARVVRPGPRTSRSLDLSCEMETCRARRRLVVRGGDLSCEGSPSGKLVGDAVDRSRTGHLASEGLDEDLHVFPDTSRDVVINDVTLTSLKTPEWSQLVFCDDFVTILFWSLWWRHICSSVTKLVFPS
jgi:hypothetical protein